MLAFAAGVPGLHLVLCGVIPDPERDDTAMRQNFRDMSKLLRNLCQDYPNTASFLDVASFFVGETGAIDTGFYAERRGQPDIHLSESGANVLACGIRNHLLNRPHSVWRI